MAASMPRADDDRDSGLDRFRRCTIAHPRLVEAKDELMNAISGAESNSLVFVFGPTGVGKTTLLQKAEQVITAGLLTELQEDRERIPVVSVEAVAPESGNFNWRDHYKRLLRQLDEPLVDYKVGQRPESEPVRPRSRFLPPPRAVASDYRDAVEQAIRHRRPVAVMIDEAQHLGKIGSGRRLLDQLDVIKSIANRTSTVHVLFGTYDLLALRNLNGQLSRRSIDVHLARYRADVPEERQIFINIVETFERELPFPEPSNLVHYWEFLYERSLGCVGIMKQWLVRAATAAVQKGCRNLAKGDLVELARRLGCTTSSTLRSYHPELCIRLRVDRYVGEDRQAHLLSVFGNDSDVGAITAAVHEKATFTLTFPDGTTKEVTLGEHASCYKGAVTLPSRKHPVRHLLAVSEELHTNGGAGRTLLLRYRREEVWATLVSFLGLPADPEWADYVMGIVERKKRVEEIDGIGCGPVLISATTEEMLEWIGEGLRSQVLAFPTSSGPILRRRYSLAEVLKPAPASA